MSLRLKYIQRKIKKTNAANAVVRIDNQRGVSQKQDEEQKSPTRRSTDKNMIFENMIEEINAKKRDPSRKNTDASLNHTDLSKPDLRVVRMDQIDYSEQSPKYTLRNETFEYEDSGTSRKIMFKSQRSKF